MQVKHIKSERQLSCQIVKTGSLQLIWIVSVVGHSKKSLKQDNWNTMRGFYAFLQKITLAEAVSTS